MSAPGHARARSQLHARSGRLVLDGRTRVAKGTAFVEFEAPAAALKAADACAKARCGDMRSALDGGGERLPFQCPARQAPCAHPGCDAARRPLRRQGAAPAVAVGGRPVEVDMALSQDAARSLAASKAAAPGGSDNRNLYLVRPRARPAGSGTLAQAPPASARAPAVRGRPRRARSRRGRRPGRRCRPRTAPSAGARRWSCAPS